jgi:hypothetical protein
MMVISIWVLSGIAARGDAVQDYYDVMTSYFKGSHWIPVVIPRGEQIGNVYNVRNLQFVADGKTCFPQLMLPVPMSTVLPTTATGGNVNGALAAGVKDVATAEAQLGASEGVNIELFDPEVSAFPAVTLATLYDPQKCRFLQKEIESTLAGTPFIGDTLHVVVGEILFAKRKITANYKNNVSAKAELSNWQRFIRLVGLSASADISTQSDRSVTVTTTKALPVAVRPAFVPDKFPDVRLGLDNQQVPIRFAPLNAEAPAQQQQLDDFVDKLRDVLPRSGSLKDF